MSHPDECKNASSAQHGGSGGILPPARFKLEEHCRLFRIKRRGAAFVEFAIVAPLFFLMVFGMIEFGRIAMVRQVLADAAREAAQVAALEGATTSDVEQSVEKHLSRSQLSAAKIRITPDLYDTANSRNPVAVEVSLPLSDVSYLPHAWFPGSHNLRERSEARGER